MSANPAAGGGEKAAASGQADCTPTLAGRRFFCSWSGGKDAYLAFARAVAAGGRPQALVCMLHEDGDRSRGHGLPVALLEAQAAALGVPLVTGATTWDDYEATFVGILHGLKRQGVEAGVFGDIDLEGHRVWVEEVCEIANVSCHVPLWQGADAAARLDASFLGRELTAELVAELEAAGADACGEEGEYHTMVTAAPLFSAPVPLVWDGLEERDGHWTLKFTAVEAK
jgi:diphthine-ammonia ligase